MVTAVASLKLLPAFGGSERRRNKAGFLRVCRNKTGLRVTAVLPSLHLAEMSEWVQNLMTDGKKDRACGCVSFLPLGDQPELRKG